MNVRNNYLEILLNNMHFMILSIVLSLNLIEFIRSQSISLSSSSTCRDVLCFQGRCQNGMCICYNGWQGSACQQCSGRIKLNASSGYITDGIENYSINLQCTWIIETNDKNAIIRLQFVQFETEFMWDHLYIFDGDSVFSPVLATLSGALVRDGQVFQSIPEITAHSGRAYLYFYSDAATIMSGFNISYSINTCVKNCSGHGVCVEKGLRCICDAGYDGEACDRVICPNNCSGHGVCDKELHECICDLNFVGTDCSQSWYESYWSGLNVIENVKGRALHQSILYENSMFVIGGEYYESNEFLMKFDLTFEKWESIRPHLNSQLLPLERFGHSVVLYEDKLYMFGGMMKNGTITHDLWCFDIHKESWDLLINTKINTKCFIEFCSPLSVLGHTATLVNNTMIIIFGYNPVYGYLNNVQEYSFATKMWSLVETRGALIKGVFGHSSTYDYTTQIIYVFGGCHSVGSLDTFTVDLLYGYNHKHKSWILLNPSLSQRYLHTSTIINGLMFIYGGNRIPDNNFTPCYTSQFLVYDIACDTWRSLKESSSALLPNELGSRRSGHSSILYNDSIYIFGGFNGVMLNSILKYSPGDCYRYTMSDECAQVKPGTKCVWNSDKNVCQSYSSLETSQASNAMWGPCDNVFANFTDLCQRQTKCASCLENTYGCVWCGDSCFYQKCRKNGIKDDIKSISDSARCEEDVRSSNCDKLHNCHSCNTEYHCGWQRDHKCYTYIRDYVNKTEKTTPHDDLRPSCEAPCHTRTTCENCTQGSCMWCSSLRRCIESTAYAAIFPTAQCMEWTVNPFKCSGLTCSDIQTCDKCLMNPWCGWCEDGNGVGICLEGSSTSPYMWNGTHYSLVLNACPASHWHFFLCPECQCNGHSHCISPNVCHKPCKHLTEGSHCQYCMAGYYGNPINGGNCTPCSCDNHSVFCNRESGKCHCTTRGIIGHHCEKCDEQSNFIGNPQEEGGSCFYNLTMGYEYTFNMSRPDDRFYTHINFVFIPETPTNGTELKIKCNKYALVNISIGSTYYQKRSLHERLECENLKLRMSYDEKLFGNENPTFYVKIFALTTPFIVSISFDDKTLANVTVDERYICKSKVLPKKSFIKKMMSLSSYFIYESCSRNINYYYMQDYNITLTNNTVIPLTLKFLDSFYLDMNEGNLISQLGRIENSLCGGEFIYITALNYDAIEDYCSNKIGLEHTVSDFASIIFFGGICDSTCEGTVKIDFYPTINYKNINNNKKFFIY